MNEAMQQQATARLEQRLAAAGVQDPRQPFRRALKVLREQRPTAFRDALRHYEEELVPAIASGEIDPLDAWLAYGRRIAELTGAGRYMSVDATGRAREEAAASPEDSVLIFIPREPPLPAVLLRAPENPTLPQQASIELLISGRLSS